MPLPGGFWQGAPTPVEAPVAQAGPPQGVPQQAPLGGDRAWVPPQPQEKNFFERLFGG